MKAHKITVAWNLVDNALDPSQMPAPDQIVLTLRKSGVMSVDEFVPTREYSFMPLVAFDRPARPEHVVAWAPMRLDSALYEHLARIAGRNAQGKVKQASKWLDRLKPASAE